MSEEKQPFFHQFRWKLFLSYTIVTTAALLLIEVLLIGGTLLFFINNARFTPEEIYSTIQENWIPVVQPYLSPDPQKISLLTNSLNKYRNFLLLSESINISDNLSINFKTQDYMNLIFLDKYQNPIDSIPHIYTYPDENLMSANDIKIIPLADNMRIYNMIDPETGEIVSEILKERMIFEQLEYNIKEMKIDSLITSAYQGEKSPENLMRVKDEQIWGVIPVYDKYYSPEIVGMILFNVNITPIRIIHFQDLAAKVLISGVILTLFSAAIGTAFGMISSQEIVTRLSDLSTVINHWAKGNFSAQNKIARGDELDKLAQDLNKMANHIEALLVERQEMSIIKERNRLARDLHDSVKQETFGASAHLAAARSLINHNPELARKHLEEANEIMDLVRSELTNLIHELYPPSLEDHTLDDSIESFTSNWSKIYDIQVNYRIHGYNGLAKNTEKSLYLILQEALSNVSRHSGATNVDILLEQTDHQVILQVVDNGSGFDVEDHKFGIGIKSMQERTNILGGTINFDSKRGQGTAIRIELPMELIYEQQSY
ncbi:MAG: sensor histidine kinase [Anaerolineaceae bacterium]|nr:sensor histidine kinase [Anaerolineaceae bacterium]